MGIDFRNPLPLHKQIHQDLVNNIQVGNLKVGDKLKTQYELVKKYDVSLITVKRALSDLINEGILFARVGKGTFVARRPSNIDYSKHLTIAYILKDLDNPYYHSMVSSVESNLSENKCNMMLYSSDNQRDREEQKIRYFIDMGVSGLILGSMSHSPFTSSLITELQEKQFPCVMVSHTEDPSMCFVGTNQVNGGFIATEHLIKTGYSDIGYVNGEEGNLIGEARKRGYVKALTEHNLSVNENYLYRIKLNGKRDDFKSGYDVGVEFCNRSERPRAMFIYNDLSALGFIDALAEFGLKVPEDVAIIGFDDIANGRSSANHLTSVHQPTDKIGKLAVENLLKMIHGETPDTPLNRSLNPELVVRESCGAK
jgi:DNA-binding LacI/PurR family transcriptional regulator